MSRSLISSRIFKSALSGSVATRHVGSPTCHAPVNGYAICVITESEKAQRLSRLFLFSRYDLFPQIGETVQRVVQCFVLFCEVQTDQIVDQLAKEACPGNSGTHTSRANPLTIKISRGLLKKTRRYSASELKTVKMS